MRKKISCPSCQSARCRESRWRSSEEKSKYQNSFPYRCLDCSFRFLAPIDAKLSKTAGLSIPAVVLSVAAAIGATLWLTQDEAESPLTAMISVAALDPEIRKAAEAGDPGAQFRLGEALLLDPSRTAESSAKGVQFLQMSAENGSTEAMIFLGRLSRSGIGILQNFGQASKWIQTAAARGNPEGMLELGRLYRDGVGVEKDLVLAYVWFNRAAAARNLDAVREREAVARMLAPEELVQAQNRSHAAASEGDKFAGGGEPRAK